MASLFELLPVELINNIVHSLHRDDTKSLRRTSRTMCFKINVDSWKQFFRTKTVPLTRSFLEDFVAVTQSGHLGCEISNLTLAAPASGFISLHRSSEATAALQDAEREIDSFREDDMTILLSQAFNNIKENGVSGALDTLILRGSSISYEDRTRIVRFTRRCTRRGKEPHGPAEVARAFRAVMTSLSRTELRITSLLDMVPLTNAKTNLPIGKLKMLESIHDGLAKSLSSLKTLKFNVSSYSKDEAPQSEVDRLWPSLGTLLRCTPALERLHFEGHSGAQIIQQIVEVGRFPLLTHFVVVDYGCRCSELAALKDVAPRSQIVNKKGEDIRPIDSLKKEKVEETPILNEIVTGSNGRWAAVYPLHGSWRR